MVPSKTDISLEHVIDPMHYKEQRTQRDDGQGTHEGRCGSYIASAEVANRRAQFHSANWCSFPHSKPCSVIVLWQCSSAVPISCYINITEYRDRVILRYKLLCILNS